MNKIMSVLGLVSVISLSGCVGTLIGATTDAAIAVAKVPFKVGGAVVHAVTPNPSATQ